MNNIAPALSAEHWERVLPAVRPVGSYPAVFAGEREKGIRGLPALSVDIATERHAFAALALYGQPFGFHINDVDFLRSVGHIRADEIASKIEALLPPRTDETQAP